MESVSRTANPALDHRDGWTAAGLFLFSLILYIRTLVPGLIPNDSAEFQTLAYTLDHAHTTGYEVYLILARLFIFLPIGDVAYRVNLFSAFMGALTAALVYLSGRVLSGRRWGAGLGALALAISATFWSQAIIAEVYTAGSAFTAGVMLLVLLWNGTRRSTFLFAAGLLGGLGIGVHGTIVLLAPAVLLLLLLNAPALARWWIPALGGALTGLLLMAAAFAYVDLHDSQASILNTAYRPSISRWDMQISDLDSLPERFAFLVFARQWRVAMFTDPGEQMPEALGRLILSLFRDFSPLVIVLMIAGLVFVFRRQARLGWFFLAAILVHLVYTLNYEIGDIYVFYISLYVYLSILAAEGVTVLLRYAVLLRAAAHSSPTAQLRSGLVPAAVVLLLLLAVLPFAGSRIRFLQVGQARWDFMNLESNARLANWQASIRDSVEALPENAIVLTDWYNLYGYVYEAHVEQGRPDLLFIEAYPFSTKPGMAESLLVFLAQQMEQGRPVFTVSRLDELARGGFRLIGQQVGPAYLYRVEQ